MKHQLFFLKPSFALVEQFSIIDVVTAMALLKSSKWFLGVFAGAKVQTGRRTSQPDWWMTWPVTCGCSGRLDRPHRHASRVSTSCRPSLIRRQRRRETFAGTWCALKRRLRKASQIHFQFFFIYISISELCLFLSHVHGSTLLVWGGLLDISKYYGFVNNRRACVRRVRSASVG